MVPSTPRPLWGWTAPVRLWLTMLGTIGALGLIAARGGGSPDRPADPAPRLIVDPNTAPPVVLAALPHLGPAMVGRIVAQREKAPFRSLEDLDARVRGIGPATAASLRPFLQLERSAAKAVETVPAAMAPCGMHPQATLAADAGGRVRPASTGPNTLNGPSTGGFSVGSRSLRASPVTSRRRSSSSSSRACSRGQKHQTLLGVTGSGKLLSRWLEDVIARREPALLA